VIRAWEEPIVTCVLERDEKGGTGVHSQIGCLSATQNISYLRDPVQHQIITPQRLTDRSSMFVACYKWPNYLHFYGTEEIIGPKRTELNTWAEAKAHNFYTPGLMAIRAGG
jgi:hypothetical protein